MSDPTVVIARLQLDAVSPDPVAFLRRVLGQLGPFQIVPLVPDSSRAREEREAHASTRSANPLADFFRIELPDDKDPEAVLSLLNSTQGVSTAYIEPEYSLPMGVSTPDLVSSQSYLGPAPYGIDASYLWDKGVTGRGVTLAAVEMGWLVNHEDFDSRRITLHGPINPDPYSIQHGTASVGVTFATGENQFGITGIASDVDAVHCFSVFGAGNSPAAAILAAVNGPLKKGDVLLIELQAAGPDKRRWIPIEFFEAEFRAIEYATSMGITVVAAAGNGETDLDSEVYCSRFDRAARDSGAILVGAGGAPGSVLTRCRLLLSNWGSRVDVQAYGEKVGTTGFGLSFGKANGLDETRWYTNGFNGTSSAAAIVAGACVLMQSFAEQKLGRPLEPREIRDVLVATGTAQAGHLNSPAAKHIGPLPNLRCAVQQLIGSPCDMQSISRDVADESLVHSGHPAGSHGDSTA